MSLDTETKKPIAIVISDIHFNLNTLDLASAALFQAIEESNKRQLPLVIAGDLHDTKAIIRAEVANKLLSLLNTCDQFVHILVGNHDRINEKHSEHGLNYLSNLATIIAYPSAINLRGITTLFIPYQSDPSIINQYKNNNNQLVIMHQGVNGAFMGDYIQDKTSIEPNFNVPVISGHYHKHQTVGSVTYIGNPYTMSFGEANDGPKGFLQLYSDGSFDRIYTNLRKHIVVERTPRNIFDKIENLNENDLLLIKLTGPLSELQTISKKVIADKVVGHMNFRLDKIPTSKDSPKTNVNLTEFQILDNIIEGLNDSVEHKTTLKQLWKDILNESN